MTINQVYKKRLKIMLMCAATAVIAIGAFIILKYTCPLEISSRVALMSLPYVTWHPAADTIDKIGVVKYDAAKSFKGINIYGSDSTPVFYLVDMHGRVLHRWPVEGAEKICYARMCKNGDLLAIIEYKLLIRLDWDSNVKWTKKGAFHHDVCVAENGDIYTLEHKCDRVFKFGLPVQIINDYIIVLSADGKIKRTISLFDVLKKQIPLRKIIRIYCGIFSFNHREKADRLKGKDRYPLDILHVNRIEIINRDIRGLCRKGDVLICARDLDLVGILDIKREKLIWSWGSGYLDCPHHPSLLENGNILIFDNGYRRGYSRVIEIDPLTKDIVREYKSNPPERFFSKDRGENQRLPNGNTLITESDRGHVFEVTPAGEIVWEFYNPEIRKDAKERAGIYRMMRITDPENYPSLKNLQ